MELHGLPRGIQLVGVRFAIWLVVPTNEDYRNLTITNELMPLPIRSIGCACRMNGRGPHLCTGIQVRDASAPRLRAGLRSQVGIRAYLFSVT
jgi:hypothetical protein